MQFTSIEGVVNCTTNVKQIILLLLMPYPWLWKGLEHRFDNSHLVLSHGLLPVDVTCCMLSVSCKLSNGLSGTLPWIRDKQTDIGVFLTRDLNQCATTGCLISHDRGLNAAKNILFSRVKNDQSYSREIRRKKSWCRKGSIDWYKN